MSRHARARSVTIRLQRRRHQVLLNIADDGAGASPQEKAPGLGLVGMRERVEALGGDIAIESTAGNGFRIRAVIPVPGAGA